MRPTICLGAALLITTLLITGCTQNTNNQNSALATLAAKATQIPTLSYTLTTTTAMGAYNVNITTQFWQKPHYMKTQTTIMGFTTTIISRPNGTFSYEPMTHTWTLTTQAQPKSATNYTLEMLAAHLTQTGTETLDGKQTTIVEYTQVINKTNAQMRIWLWDDNGLPIKIVTTTTVLNQTVSTTTLMTDISFDDIQDSVFDLT